MPGFDQTGPRGMGPLTGRGMGACGGGFGCGRGLGRGYGRFAGRAYLTNTEEVEGLEEEAKYLEADLKALKEKISEIKGN